MYSYATPHVHAGDESVGNIGIYGPRRQHIYIYHVICFGTARLIYTLGSHSGEDFLTDLVCGGLNPLLSPSVYGVLKIQFLKIENPVDVVRGIKSLASSLINGRPGPTDLHKKCLFIDNNFSFIIIYYYHLFTYQRFV